MYTTLLLVVCCIVLYFAYDKWCRMFFWRLGIPGPPSTPIFGNFLEWFVVFHSKFQGYFEKYGKIVGVYNFRKPLLLVSDPDVVKQILVKDFHHFENREQAVLDTGILRQGLLALRDERWRKVRNLLSPTFTSIKMKHMTGLMCDCCKTLVERFKKLEAEGKPIECKELYGSFAMDVIGTCAFGLRVNSLTNKDDPFVGYAKRAFTFSITNPAFLIVLFFPWMAPILNYFKMGLFPKEIEDFLCGVFEKAIEKRKGEGNAETTDFLQLMLNAHKEDAVHQPRETTEDDVMTTDLAQETSWKPKEKVALNMQEILGNSIIFFLAGYETTSTSLGFISYLLATNKCEQDLLMAEVTRMAPTPAFLTYETVSRMEYLNMVVMEALRIYPPGEVLERVCNKEISYNGITIKKGQYIFIPIWNLQHDPDLWPDPETFKPERFSKEQRAKNHPYSWLAFGMGPRSCIGVRFAILEIKMAIVSILQKFRFETCPETEIPPKLGNLGFLTPPNGITLRICPRHS